MCSLDRLREIAEVTRLFPRAQMVATVDVLGVPPELEVPHRGLVIVPRFALDHPFSPPHIFLRPGILSRHYYIHEGEREARLCFCKPAEWHPRFRLIHAVTAAMRFLNDWLAHRVN